MGDLERGNEVLCHTASNKTTVWNSLPTSCGNGHQPGWLDKRIMPPFLPDLSIPLDLGASLLPRFGSTWMIIEYLWVKKNV